MISFYNRREVIIVKANTCQNCKHFRIHYIRYEKNNYVPISDGHCVHPRLKFCKTETPACKNFSPCKSDT